MPEDFPVTAKQNDRLDHLRQYDITPPDERDQRTTIIEVLDGIPHLVTRDNQTGKVYTNRLPDPYQDSPFFESGRMTRENFKRGLQQALPGSDNEQALRESYFQNVGLEDFYKTYNPNQQFFGELAQSAPGAFLGGHTKLGQYLAGMVAGSGEGVLDYDPDSAPLARGLQGAAVGAVAEAGGGFVDRVLGGVSSLVKGMRGRGARQVGDVAGINPNALRVQERGYRVERPSDLSMPDDPMRDTVENLELSALSSGAVPSFFKQNATHNQRTLMQRLADTFETPGTYTELTDDFLISTRNALRLKQRGINRNLDDVAVPESVLDVVNRSDFTKEGRKLGTANPWSKVDDYYKQLDDWDGLGTGPTLPTFSGEELVDLRSSLTEEAAEAGSSVNRRQYGQIIDELDDSIASQIKDPQVLGEYAKLREQWRLYQGLKSPGVMGEEGAVNLKTLRNRLRSDANFGEDAMVSEQLADYSDEELALLAERFGVPVQQLVDVPDREFADQNVRDVIGDVNALAGLRRLSNTSNTQRSAALYRAVTEPAALVADIGNNRLLNYLNRTGANPGGLGHTFARGYSRGLQQGVPLRSAGNAVEPGSLPTAVLPGVPEAVRTMGIGIGAQPMLDAALYPFVGSEDDRLANQ
jgi:hypothetical protein